MSVKPYFAGEYQFIQLNPDKKDLKNKRAIENFKRTIHEDAAYFYLDYDLANLKKNVEIAVTPEGSVRVHCPDVFKSTQTGHIERPNNKAEAKGLTPLLALIARRLHDKAATSFKNHYDYYLEIKEGEILSPEDKLPEAQRIFLYRL